MPPYNLKGPNHQYVNPIEEVYKEIVADKNRIPTKKKEKPNAIFP